MAHTDHLNRSMFNRLFHNHYCILSKDSSQYDVLKRKYCLKCIDNLRQQQGWAVPAIKYLNEILCYNSVNTFKQVDQSLIYLLTNNNIIPILIKSISICQQDAWNKTQGHVKVDTLVDSHFTLEESIERHLDLLSFLLEKDNFNLPLIHSEELWNILINNAKASSFGRELGFRWFIDCFNTFNYESQTALFTRRISELDSVCLCLIGNYDRIDPILQLASLNIDFVSLLYYKYKKKLY